MLKYIAIGAVLIVVVFAAVIMYCALIISSNSDDYVDKMFDDYWKEKLGYSEVKNDEESKQE